MVKEKNVLFGGVKIPMRMSEEDRNILAQLYKNKIQMKWDGESLRKKEFFTLDNKTVQLKIPAPKLREYLEKGWLTTEKRNGYVVSRVFGYLGKYLLKETYQEGQPVVVSGNLVKVIAKLEDPIPDDKFQGFKLLPTLNIRPSKYLKASNTNEYFIMTLVMAGIYDRRVYEYNGVYFTFDSKYGLRGIEAEYAIKKFGKPDDRKVKEGLKLEDSKEEGNEDSLEAQAIQPKNKVVSIKKTVVNDLQKFKFKTETTIEERVIAMLAYYVKHIDFSELSEDLVLDAINLTYYSPKKAPYTKIEKYENKEVIEKFVNATVMGKWDKSELEYYKVYTDKPEYTVERFADNRRIQNMVVVVQKKRKLPKNLLRVSWSMPTQDKTYALKVTGQTDFGKVGVISCKQNMARKYVARDIGGYNFTEDELLIVNSLVTNLKPLNDWYTKRGKEELYNETIEKLYKAFTKIYTVAIQEEVERKRSMEYNGYARSYEDKKNISPKVRDAMENSKFIGNTFKYVEIDNDVDLDLYKKVEEDYLKNKNKLPKLPIKIDLRFRRLGNIRVGGERGAGGVFYPGLNTIAIDLDSTTSFIHEYGHAVDYLGTNTDVKLSDQEEFKNILDIYSKELQESNKNMDLQLLSYYLETTEIFARSFEVYKATTIKNSSLGKDQFNGEAYEPLLKHKDLILNYFKNVLNI